MKKSRLLFLLLSVALLVPVITGTLSRAATEDDGSSDSLSRNLSVFSEVLSLIRRAYVDETSIEELLAGALDGTTDALDPLATFVPADDVERYRQVRQIGRAHSGLTVAKDRGIAFVVGVDAGSPGDAAGLEQGDILAKIDETSTRPMPLWMLQSVLAGDPGTELELEILRRGQTLDLDLTLATYESPAPRLDRSHDQPVLQLTRFEQQDLESVRGLLASLAAEGADKLLIDIRGVAGGDAAAAYALAGLFAEGELGELQTRGEANVQFRGNAAPLWQGDSVILIDNGTQGASEVFATVLQQAADSRLVGRRSFGLAGRQRMVALSDGSQILLTDAFYSGPDGEPIDQSLLPDVSVAGFVPQTSEDSADEEEAEDPTLQKGLDLLLEGRQDEARDVA